MGCQQTFFVAGPFQVHLVNSSGGLERGHNPFCPRQHIHLLGPDQLQPERKKTVVNEIANVQNPSAKCHTG